MSDDIRASTCCPSDTPDTAGNGIWGYAVDGATAHPPPTITCPEDFIAWLKDGEYIVPDFSSAILINGLCQVDSEFTITQQPPAGTVITVGGAVIILIIIIDGHENQVECDFTIDIHDPEDPNGTTPPTVLPPWVYTPYLLFYYTANDTQCTVGALDEDLPCWFRRDVGGLVGNPSPYHLTNGGDAVLERSQSFVAGFSPGPIFNRGSVWSNMLLNAFLYHSDHAALQLLNTDFTVRFAFKLISLDDGGSWNLVSKYDTLGWRVKVVRSGSEYRLSPELRNNSTSITTTYRLISLDTWYYVAITFNAALGRLRLYLDGQQVEETTSAGFALSGEASQLRIGQPASGSGSDPDVIACWSLDDTSWSDSVAGKDMTASGTPSLATGKINDAMKDAGSSGHLVRTDTDLQLATGDWTVRAWGYGESFILGGSEWILAGNYNTRGWKMFITVSGGVFQIGYTVRNSLGEVGLSQAPISAATWYHSVLTYESATRTVRWYLNAVQQGPAFVMASPFDASDTTTFQIGGPGGSTTARVDEVRIWDVVKDLAAIVTDYNAGNGTGCPFDLTSAANCYHDEIGGWLQEWNAARVAQDYAIMTAGA